MRSSLVLKSVLFCVLFNGAAVATTQAAHLAREINRLGNTCEAYGPKVGMTAADQGDAAPTVANAQGEAAAVGDISFADSAKNQLNNLIESAAKVGATVNSSSCDGLMAQVAIDKLTADSGAQSKVLRDGDDVLTHQSNAVPLSAAAWLFSSALFGFVMVANRRKV